MPEDLGHIMGAAIGVVVVVILWPFALPLLIVYKVVG